MSVNASNVPTYPDIGGAWFTQSEPIASPIAAGLGGDVSSLHGTMPLAYIRQGIPDGGTGALFSRFLPIRTAPLVHSPLGLIIVVGFLAVLVFILARR